MKYYVGTKGLYSSSVKLINCLIFLVLLTIMGFAALPSFLMVQANASKDKVYPSSDIRLVGFSSNGGASGLSNRSIVHSFNKRRAQTGAPGRTQISRVRKRGVKNRSLLKESEPVGSKKIYLADFESRRSLFLPSAEERTVSME